MDDENRERNARAKQRQIAFLEALPKALRDEEDSIPVVVRAMNASSRSKLQRIYRLADAIMEHRKPFVACKKGCADCCHMNITISTEEAARIGAASGRTVVKLLNSVHRETSAFASIPCPFLEAGSACSIYADRPLVCRNHASFDEDAKLCNPNLMNDVRMPVVSYAGIEEAFGSLVLASKNSVLADIRDFFPTGSVSA